MKAFLLGVVLTVVIAVIAGVGLEYVSQSSQDAFTEHSNVRL